MKNKRKKYPDVIKFISCIVVYLCHFQIAFYYERFGDIPIGNLRITNPIVNGNFAVCLFLAVSNFIYFSKGVSYSENDFANKLKNDILNRYIRFFVPAAIVNFVVFIFFKLGLFLNLNTTFLSHLDSKTWFSMSNHAVLRTLYYTVCLCFFSGMNPPLWCYPLLFLQPLLTLLLIPVMKKINEKVCIAICLCISLLCLLQNSYWAAIPLCFAIGLVREESIILKFLFLFVFALFKVVACSFELSKVSTNLLFAFCLIWILNGLYFKNISKEQKTKNMIVERGRWRG